MLIHPNVYELHHQGSSYAFYQRLYSHNNMNFDKPNANIIFVKSLVGACHNILTEKEATSVYTKIIIKTFELDMMILEENELLNWKYCDANKNPLTDNQIKKIDIDYATFLSLYVHFNLLPITSKFTYH